MFGGCSVVSTVMFRNQFRKQHFKNTASPKIWITDHYQWRNGGCNLTVKVVFSHQYPIPSQYGLKNYRNQRNTFRVYPMAHSGLGKKRKVQQIRWWWSTWGGKRVWTWWYNPSGTFWRGPKGWWYEADSEMGGYNTKHEDEAQKTLLWRCCQWCTPAN